MLRNICIFGLLFLASCEEETISNHSPCPLVILSDALPVQFWLADCDTYNETVPKGVHEKCFCAPWHCNDQITIQFQDDDSPDTDFMLFMVDDVGTRLGARDFEEIEPGIFYTSFLPSSYNICDEVVALQIIRADVYSGSGSGSSLQTIDVILDEELLAGDYIITGSITVVRTSGVAANGVASISAYDGAQEQTLETGSGAQPFTLSLNDGSYNILFPFDRIRLTAGLSGAGNFNYDYSIKIFTVVAAKSDCLDVATSHDETELLTYANGRNFAGLIHQDASPDATLNIRVPCRFFHENFPEEDEAMELTSQVVTTSSQLKSQKLLEVQMVPYYFHKKLQLVLKHQTLTINGIDYKKEEKYEIIPGNKRWPLKQATCMLTEKSSVLRNVL